jgi:hypothetical protein
VCVRECVQVREGGSMFLFSFYLFHFLFSSSFSSSFFFSFLKFSIFSFSQFIRDNVIKDGEGEGDEEIEKLEGTEGEGKGEGGEGGLSLSRSKNQNIITLEDILEFTKEVRKSRNKKSNRKIISRDENDEGKRGGKEEGGEEEEEEGGGVHCLESSMVNCFGLKYLHEYLQVPFLRLKKDIFRKQLQCVEDELKQLDVTLRSALLPSEKDAYVTFVRTYENRVR